jgi:hypothetical protein
MKTLAKFAVLLSALLLAGGASAAEKWMTLSSPTSINGTTLAPGDYKVSYKVNGSTAEVQILKGKKTVATASGQLVEQETPTSQNSVVLMNNGDGSSKLVEIQFANQKTSIRFAGDSAGGK